MHSKKMRRHIVRSSLRAGIKRTNLVLATSTKLSPSESTYLTSFVEAASRMISTLASDQGCTDFPVKDLVGSATTIRNLAERTQVTNVYELALCDLPALRNGLRGTRVHLRDVLIAMRYTLPPPVKRTKK
jgi:hypothetical protein